jgi:hypothetical protein
MNLFETKNGGHKGRDKKVSSAISTSTSLDEAINIQQNLSMLSPTFNNFAKHNTHQIPWQPPVHEKISRFSPAPEKWDEHLVI